MLVIVNSSALLRADADHAVLIDALARHLLDGDHVGLLVQFPRRVDHLRKTAARVLHEHVRQQQCERLAADQFARAPHRVPEAERLLLARKAGRAGDRQILSHEFERRVLLPLQQRHLQFELPVEMVLDDALVAPGDENEMFDAGFARLVDDVLNQRPVDHWQHFLGHRLGGRQKAGAEAGDRKDRFADWFVHFFLEIAWHELGDSRRMVNGLYHENIGQIFGRLPVQTLA